MRQQLEDDRRYYAQIRHDQISILNLEKQSSVWENEVTLQKPQYQIRILSTNEFEYSQNDSKELNYNQTVIQSPALQVSINLRYFPKQINISFKSAARYVEVKRGSNSETANLSKYVFCETFKQLKILFKTRQLTSQEEKSLIQFRKSKGHLESYPKLFIHQKFRERCKSFYSSSRFVQNVIQNKNMGFTAKIIVIKHLERIRSNSFMPIKRWKQKCI